MSRREALRATTALVGGALVAGGALAGCAPERRAARATALDADDRALVEAIADTLLPTTAASPGARAASAGAEIDLLLTDCYDAEAQRRVVRGLQDFRAACRAACGAGGFAALPAGERERLLRDLDAEAVRAGDGHWFALVRELSLRAYFASEVGMTRALRYVRVPGRWEGCVEMRPGQAARG